MLSVPTEMTASLLIGPVETWWGAQVFNPSTVALLREGFRAAWTLYPLVDEGARGTFVRPETADYLLAVGLLGYVAVELPEILAGDGSLSRLVKRDDGCLTIAALDSRSAGRIFTRFGEFVSGVVTVLDGCSIGEHGLLMAAQAGFTEATARSSSGTRPGRGGAR